MTITAWLIGVVFVIGLAALALAASIVWDYFEARRRGE